MPREYREKVLEYSLETLEREKVIKEAIAGARYALESYPAGRPNILRRLKEKGKLQ